MTRRTLLDFFADVTSGAAARPRRFSPTTMDIGRGRGPTGICGGGRARFRTGDLRAEGVAPGQAVAIWSENRPEWIAALWGALFEGVVVVPIDYRASPDFLLKVAGIVDAKAILVGDQRRSRGAWARAGDLESGGDLPAAAGSSTGSTDGVRRLRQLESQLPPPLPSRPSAPQRRHHRGNHLHFRRDGRTQGRGPHPQEHPRQHRPDRARDGEIPQVRAAVSADPLSEPAAAQPHVRTGDGDVRAADAARRKSCSRAR